MLDWVQNTPLFTTSQLYFLLEKEVNRKINSLWTFYSKELKKFQTARSGVAMNDTFESNKWVHFFGTNLIGLLQTSVIV